MQTQRLSAFITQQKPSLTHDVRVVVVHDPRDQQILQAISQFLEEAGYFDRHERLAVLAATSFGNLNISQQLERDHANHLTSFVMITQGALKHYFKSADQRDFSLRMTMFE